MHWVTILPTHNDPYIYLFIFIADLSFPSKKALETIVIQLPKLAILFQALKLSGKSGTLRGIPAKPKKCIGKKHKFTPIKVVQK